MESEGNKVEVSVYQKPKKGNYYCGDSYFYKETDKEFVCALADGLGSGEFAKEFSQAVMDVIDEHVDEPIEKIIKECNNTLSNKRGAVLGLLRINFQEEWYSFTSIGNIGIIVIPPKGKRKRNIPSAGYLTGYHKPYRVTRDALSHGMLFFMFSDGVNERTLSSKTFVSPNLNQIMEDFKLQQEKVIDDDTTFIAMRYG
ncbi:SpoIIE family protein phosphatase [Pontibacillus marinus]|uniref:Indirect negative regulator of sigma-B activity n=1 Tax=Pontibacillus marinus BH030004 = DSM 16465 TaxID=1385511 RepID=A0A0A5G6Y5_9BACI|nr:SpoIIE family protein phosphatase [Pontibacillus marinus]KGX87824.1 indirect negative regulator of sigma-B activity [Pontibacillus marinus BH030004 = DSM 16465]